MKPQDTPTQETNAKSSPEKQMQKLQQEYYKEMTLLLQSISNKRDYEECIYQLSANDEGFWISTFDGLNEKKKMNK